MDNLMQKRPFIVGKDNYTKLERVSLSKGDFQEEWLQKLLQNSPQLLPVAEIDAIYAPLVCIGREVATAAGYIDNLYISPKGYITIVETKLWRNPEARREVVGQIIDYAKELKQFSYERLDKIVQAYNKSYFGKEQNLFETMLGHQFLREEDETLFVDLVEKNLFNARFLLLIVGDGIRDGVWRMTEFLNSTPNMLYSLGLVELEVYRLPTNDKLVVPNLLMKTQTVERGVFRFEQGRVSPVMVEHKEFEDYIMKSKGKISKEDFIQLLTTRNPKISLDNASRFLEDLVDLGYVITPYGKEDLRVKYPMPGGGSYLNVIYFSSKKNGRAYKNVNSLERDLLKFGYSPEIARSFYKELELYQDDNLGGNSTINHDLMKMINSSDEVISAFDKLRSNF
ncbi:hypothetical protein E4100_04915 [Soehngenia longivitae]|uniref:DUF91 domain-containing protein n=1 Tax=Soehngenia longivitae TaxID=2562294 RepID=A0A4Z0D6C0_9FIRM|nr:hypothetical protein [Soehngenia longivitae]TFZ40414.1 hypothetical protein E4100_04915 [Soehngenia longivitae]